MKFAQRELSTCSFVFCELEVERRLRMLLSAATRIPQHKRPTKTRGRFMLRHFMDTKGVTQAELSRETAISKSSASEVLAGKKPLSRQMIRKLAAYFQVDASVLAANL
jgi:antitoxin component HigA of HigAB toxin-antitoxin module